VPDFNGASCWSSVGLVGSGLRPWTERKLFGNSVCLMFTDKEMIPARKAIDDHAQYFVLNNKLLLSLLEAFVQWSAHCALLEMFAVYSLCVLAEQTVVPTNAFQYSSLWLAVPRNAPDTPTTHRDHFVFSGQYILSGKGGEELSIERIIVVSGWLFPVTGFRWPTDSHFYTQGRKEMGFPERCIPLRMQDYRLSPETN